MTVSDSPVFSSEYTRVPSVGCSLCCGGSLVGCVVPPSGCHPRAGFLSLLTAREPLAVWEYWLLVGRIYIDLRQLPSPSFGLVHVPLTTRVKGHFSPWMR